MATSTKHRNGRVSRLSKGYKIKLVVAIEDNGEFTETKEYIVPTVYKTLRMARFHILMDIEHRLGNTMFFRSQRQGFDLVRYSKEVALNTYLAYKILPIY